MDVSEAIENKSMYPDSSPLASFHTHVYDNTGLYPSTFLHSSEHRLLLSVISVE
jgi:hypothetical protein